MLECQTALELWRRVLSKNLYYLTGLLILLFAVSPAAVAQFPDAASHFLYDETTFPAEQRAFCSVFRDVNSEARKYASMTDLQKAQSALKAPSGDEAWKRVHALLSPNMSITKWHGILRPGRVEKDGVRLEFVVTCYPNGPGAGGGIIVIFASGPPNSPSPYSEAGPKPFSDPVVQVFTKRGQGGPAEVSGKLYPCVNQPNVWFANAMTLRNAPDGHYLTAFTNVALFPAK